jgi:hypothetical protein
MATVCGSATEPILCASLGELFPRKLRAASYEAARVSEMVVEDDAAICCCAIQQLVTRGDEFRRIQIEDRGPVRMHNLVL